jgi:Leucine-rich repeat (LRR) protein
MKNTTIVQLLTILGAFWVGSAQPLPGQAPKVDTSIFPDKNLESAVRKCVFEKRDNDKPLIEADLVNISTITAAGLQITNLTGLEKCKALASLDLARNAVVDLGPLKDLAGIQYLNLASNQIQDIAPLAGVKAMQYLELSGNRVANLQPLAGLTNLASVYLSTNQITDISPLLGLPKVYSLYLDNNPIKSLEGISGLSRLGTLSLNGVGLKDLSVLKGLNSLYFLFLERNKITDLTPVYEACKKDNEGPKRFAPFLNLFLTGNSLGGSSKKQIATLKDMGVKVTN